MARKLTAPGRLALIANWINGDRTDERLVLRDLEAFVASFDGSADASYIEAPAENTDGIPDFIQQKTQTVTTPTADELDHLRVQLRLLIEQGFGEHAQLATLPGSSLRFAARSGVARSKPTWGITEGGNLVRSAKALKQYRASGAYVMQVYGTLLDVVPFLVMHLLTQPDMLSVRRCPVCGRFLVIQPGKRGRPRLFCEGRGCWERSYGEKKEADKQRAEARKQRRSR